MKTYKVAVEWSVVAEVEVQANSLEDAIMEVESNDSLIPSEGSYINGSLTINRDMTNFLNKKSFC